MLDSPQVKSIYKEIQKKLYYMIPEKWNSVYLYSAITEKAYQMPIGEMFFYYFPKSGIFRRNPVNVYEIPAKFNIPERQYMQLVKNLYGSIEELREEYKRNNQKLWTNITISIENFRFKIEYNYEPLEENEYNSYDRHIIWRYKNLGTDLSTLTKKERAIIEKYMANHELGLQEKEVYDEPIYKKAVNNILDYNRSEFESPLELGVMEEFEADRKSANNQILAGIEMNKNSTIKKIKK